MIAAVYAPFRPGMECQICPWSEEMGSREEIETHQRLIGHTDAGGGQAGHWNCISQIMQLWMDRREADAEEHLPGSLSVDDTYTCPTCRRIVTVSTADPDLGPLMVKVRRASGFLRAAITGDHATVTAMLRRPDADEFVELSGIADQEALKSILAANHLEIGRAILNFIYRAGVPRLDGRNIGMDLLFTAEVGLVDLVRMILNSEGADTIVGGAEGIGGAFSIAAVESQVPIARAILNSDHAHRMPVNGEYSVGFALALAALQGNSEIVRLILESVHAHRMPVNGPHSIGYALALAASQGNSEIVRLILESVHADQLPAGDEYSVGYALEVAAKFNKLEVLQIILNSRHAARIPPSEMMVCAFLKCLFVFRTHDEVMRAFLSSPAIRSFLNTLLDGASLGVVIAAKVSSEMLSTYPSFSAQMLSTPAISMAYITICLSLYLSFRHDVLMSLLLTRIPEALVRRLSNSVPTIPSQYLSYGRIALRSMALAICSLVAYGCLREKMRPRAVDIIE